jgi:hypothetical protein
MSCDPFSPERFEKFHEKIKLIPAPPGWKHLGPCWIYTGSLNSDGYGVFHCPGFPAINGEKRRKNVLAHRWAMAFWYGTKKLHKLTHDHLCRRQACASPRHGSAISHSANVIRGNHLRHEPIYEDPFEALGI